jgi:hypothetical protein
MQSSDDSAALWLVKVPGFLHEALAKAAQQGKGGPVGAVVAGSEREGLRFELHMDAPELRGKPAVFSIKTRPADQELKGFVQDTAGGLRLLGSVVQRADMLPAQGAAYATMLQGRLQQSEVKAATELVQAGGRRGVEEKKQLYKRGREEAATQRTAAPAQRLELSREEMVTAVLTLFEEATHWSKREIMSRTNQSERLVNEVLKELATLEAAGEHKNEFVLRDEFRIKAAAKKQKKQS